jgi:hypothetical protein
LPVIPAAESKEQGAMSFGIVSIEHFFARAAKGAMTVGKAIVVAANNPKVQADVKAVESITAMVSPTAAAIEDAAYHCFGLVASAASDASQPLNADGSISVTVGAEVLADIKALASSVEQFAGIAGISKPAAPALAAASKS